MMQVSDVSDKMMLDRSKAQKELQQLVSAGVSHEIRNPLSALISNLWGLMQFLKDLDQIISILTALLGHLEAASQTHRTV